jgi:hypothetical protein
LIQKLLLSGVLQQKNKAIMAKPVSSIVSDLSLIEKLLLDTLEGKAAINSANVICVGGDVGEAWQQTAKKLLSKYTVTDITSTGWLVCTPISGYAEDAVEVITVDGGEFTIIGLWGETLSDGTQNVQRGRSGDFVLRSRANHDDVWVVKRNLFNSTYTIE